MRQTIRTAMKLLTQRAGYTVRRVDPSWAKYPFVDHVQPPQDPAELNQIAVELLDFFGEVDPLYRDITSGPLRIAGAWRQDLLDRRVRQLQAIEAKDLRGYVALLRDAFRDELIGGMWSHGYFEDGKSRLANMPDFFSELTSFEYMTGRSAAELPQRSAFGNPWGLQLADGIVKFTDPWHGLQADAVLRLIAAFGSPNETLTIVDLGSGYGGTASKIARWLSRPVRLVLIDIPLNLSTAYAFLASEYGRGQVRLLKRRADVRAALSEPLQHSVEFVLVPSLFVEETRGQSIDVLLNAGSLSEMDFDTIRFYLQQLCGPNTATFVEMNSNQPTLNYGGHVEVPSSQFPVPESHALISRAATLPGARFIQSIYLNRRFTRR